MPDSSQGQERVTINFDAPKVAGSPQEVALNTLINQVGSVGLGKEWGADISTLLPRGFNPDHITESLELYANGRTSAEVEEKTDNYVAKQPQISQLEQQSLYSVPYLLKTYEEFKLKENKGFQKEIDSLLTANNVQVETHAEPINQISFEKKELTLSPVIRQTIGMGTDIIKDKAKDLLGKYVKQAIKSGGKKLATEAAKKGLGIALKAGVQAAAGVTLPIVGNLLLLAVQIGQEIIGVIKKLGSRFINWIRENKEKVAAAAFLLVTTGLLIGNTFFILGGLAIGATAWRFGGLQAFLSGITAAFILPAVTMATGSLMAFIVILIVLTAIIVFIINSGAYIVPPGGPTAPSPFTGLPQYIRVEKEANPPGPFANNQNITVTYTVTITPLLGSIINITFVDECVVFADYDQVCPSPQNVTAGLQSGSQSPFSSIQDAAPGIITTTDPYIVTFQMTFPSGQYNDAAIRDIFRVQADVEGAGRTEGMGSRTIIIGNPPTSCIYLNGSWPEPYRTTADDAIRTLTQSFPGYVAKLCDGPDIPICYPNVCGDWGCHTHTNPDCDISLGPGGLGHPNNALYILAHELGHHLDMLDGQYLADYLDSGATSELPICTYGGTNVYEGFAEAIALYASTPTDWTSDCGGGTTFQGLYPINFDFVSSSIY